MPVDRSTFIIGSGDPVEFANETADHLDAWEGVDPANVPESPPATVVELTAHVADTQHVHGIVDTSQLVYADDPRIDTTVWQDEIDTVAADLADHEVAVSPHSINVADLVYTPVLPADQPPAVALTDAATIATDAALGNVFTVTLGGSRTMGNPTNPKSGQQIVYQLKQDATGSRLITWDTAFRFGTDITSPTLTTTVNKTDYVTFVYNLGATKWDCVRVVRGY